MTDNQEPVIEDEDDGFDAYVAQHEGESESLAHAEFDEDEPEEAAPEPEASEADEQAAEPEGDSLESELRRAREEVQQWQHRYNSDLGRQNAYQRQIEERDQRIAELEKQVQRKPELPENESIKRLADEFPEVDQAMQAYLVQQEKKLQAKYDADIRALKTYYKQQEFDRERMQRDSFRQSQIQRLAQEHPDWEEVTASNEYQQWIANAPPSIQKVAAESEDAADAAYILSSFKAATGQSQASDELKQRRQRQLQQARTVQSRSGQQRGMEPPADDGDAAFDFFASKVDQRNTRRY